MITLNYINNNMSPSTIIYIAMCTDILRQHNYNNKIITIINNDMDEDRDVIMIKCKTNTTKMNSNRKFQCEINMECECETLNEHANMECKCEIKSTRFMPKTIVITVSVKSRVPGLCLRQ